MIGLKEKNLSWEEKKVDAFYTQQLFAETLH